MKRVGSLVENLLRKHSLWQGYQQYLLVQSWSEVVGQALAEVTCAQNISNGVLRVSVKDSVWAYHLTMLKPKLIRKLNDYAGGTVVKDIFFKIEVFNKKE